MIERSHGVEKPDVVTQTMFIEIAEVRIHRVIVKVDVFVRIARSQPRLLRAHAGVMDVRRQTALFGFLHPVITIVSDGADNFFPRDNALGKLQVLDKPVLRGHGAGCGAGIMLVIIHEHDAVGHGGDRGIVVFTAM